MRRPTVLVMTHLFPTEASSVQGPWVAEQVDALAPLVDLRVLCCSQHTRDHSDRRPSGVPVEYRSIATPLGKGRIGLLASTLRYYWAAIRYVRQHAGDVDLIHAHFGFPDAVVAARVARRHGIPLVVTLHGDDAHKLLPRRGPLGAVTRNAVHCAQAVVCVSQAMAASVLQSVALSQPPVVITNGYDDSLFAVSHGPRDLGLLFVGLLVPVKNVDILLRAYASVADRLCMPLNIAGDGPLRASLEDLVDRLQVRRRVRFLGQQSRDDVARLMRHATCVVLPSSNEGWPLAVVEALACGTPVIASRVGGLPELMSSNAAGELLEPGDVDALAAALLNVTSRQWDPDAVAVASGARPWSEQAALLADLYARCAPESR